MLRIGKSIQTKVNLWLPREIGFPNGSCSKESVCSAGDTRDMGSIPGLGRFPGEGNGNPLQCSCL